MSKLRIARRQIVDIIHRRDFESLISDPQPDLGSMMNGMVIQLQNYIAQFL